MIQDPPEIRLPTEYQRKLVVELRSAGRREIGGILMGQEIQPGQFRIVDMTFQRRGGSFATFVRGASAALRALKRFFRRTGQQYRQFNYLGEWHSHPSFSIAPSPKDHQSMMKLVSNPNLGAHFVVLLIARLGDQETLEAGVTAYTPEGVINRGELVFE
jgi:hypothetical protein